MVNPVLAEFFHDPRGILKNALEKRVEQLHARFIDDPRFIIDFDWQRLAGDQTALKIHSLPMGRDAFRTLLKTSLEQNRLEV